MKMIVAECQARSWLVEMYYLGNSQMRITRADGKVLNVFNATPPTTSFVAGHFSNNKYLNHLLFSNNDIPTLETYLSDSASELTTIAAQKFFASGRKLVVKPMDAAHGHGVSVNVGSEADLNRAIELAQTFSRAVIMQDFRDHAKDLRITCINYKYAAALIRVPARVKGDGVSTIEALIKTENESPGRGENYAKPLNKIDLDKAKTFLGASINDVPSAGEYCTVLGTANVGTGGETIEVTSAVPAWLITLAEKCAKVSDLPVCGIDFLINKEPSTGDTEPDLDPRVIETNVCPSLFIHETPTFGKPQPTVKTYVDYLASL
jgi:cyanophycin synthetase